MKRDVYAKSGVGEYWVVDPARKSIEVMTLSRAVFRPVRVGRIGDKLTSDALPGLELNATDVFAGL